MNIAQAESPPPKLLAYLRLFRLPNVFTAMADIGMGFFVVNAGYEPVGSFLGLLMASGFLYTAGMVLNDVFDLEVDRRERPTRPLPSGQISWGWARTLGFGLLLGGVAVAWGTGYLDSRVDVMHWKSGAVASILAVCVLSYDAVLKKTMLGPIAMGACRFFNVLLGMSLASQGEWGFDVVQLTIAGGIAVYIVGVTYFARTEAVESNRGSLMFATAIMAGGLALLAYFPFVGETPPRVLFKSPYYWPIAVLLLAFPIIRRCSSAVMTPSPQNVQGAVKHCIFSLILLDAAVVLALCGPTLAIGVLLLSVPMYLMGKWVYST